MRVKLSSLPDAVKTYSVELPKLSGGLNLFDIGYRLKANQSPAMKNMCWRDGALSSRRGEKKLCTLGGAGLACYETTFYGKYFFHIGTSLYSFDEASGPEKLCSELPETAGSFFRYGGALYYKTAGAYIKIEYDAENKAFTAADVEAYTPVILINASPEDGSGSLYQPENRLSAEKTVWYTAETDVKDYHLPVKAEKIVRVIVDGSESGAYSYSAETGVVSFETAPPVQESPVNNTVKITYSLENSAAYKSIMDCCRAEVYGGDTQVCVVLAGSEAQPNAYFWNGCNTAMDAGYFPMDYYNFAGDSGQAVTGFGKQQGMLVIFSEASLGRASFSLTEIDSREYIQMPYVAINSAVGCDVPGSIRLVENNLVFCSGKKGVFMVKNSSASYENNIVCISGNVNGTERRPGLLAGIGSAACCFDDGKRYWLAAGGSVWLWDYSVSTYSEPSWFYFTNVPAAAFAGGGEDIYYVSTDGVLCAFCEGFTDFGGAIEREFEFAVQDFGSYERLKDVEKVILAVSSETDSLLEIDYITDCASTSEAVPVRSYSQHLTPRNLAYRMLGCSRWTVTAVRRPGCRHIRQFTMRVWNNEAGQDMSIISARIFFKYRAAAR